MVIHHPVKFDSDGHRAAGDIIVLVCRVFMQDHMTKR